MDREARTAGGEAAGTKKMTDLTLLIGADVTTPSGLKARRAARVVTAIELGMVRGGNRLIREARKYTPRDRGSLIDSYRLELLARPKRVAVTSDRPQAGPMEKGRRAGMPPVAALIAWAENKLGLSSKEARKAGWAIAINMSRHGIRVPLKADGQGQMFKRAWAQLGGRRFFVEAIRSELRKLGPL